MAIKQFTNEQLTSSDVNTYLNYGGLVWIATATATSGGTLDITSCLSGNYDAYRIVISDARTTAPAALYVTMLSGSTPAASNWTWLAPRGDYATSSFSFDKATNSAKVVFAVTDTVSIGCSIDIQQPFLTRQTSVQAVGTDARGTTGYLILPVAGILANTTSYNGIRIVSDGTFINIKASVYGYRIS